MTLLDDRPAVVPPATPDAANSQRRASHLSTWRFAARLARREVRRRPGRTLLVMLLVAVPVIAMSTASIVARSTAETDEQQFIRQYGDADVAVFVGGDALSVGAGDSDTEDGPVEPVLPALPDGTRSTSSFDAYTRIDALVDGDRVTQIVEFTDIDLNDPITQNQITLRNGRVPSGSDEVLLAPSVAEEFGVSVGDELRLVRPDLSVTVVGIGVSPSWGDSPLFVIGEFDRTLLRSDMAYIRTLVDLPDDLSAEERGLVFGDLNRAGLGQQSFDDRAAFGVNGVDGRELAWGWVAGVLAFVAVGIVIAAAFATSARRQLVTIGQLASNGASPRLVRRTMGLQGMWTGLFGAALGLSIAVVGCLAIHRWTGLLDSFAGRDLVGLQLEPVDLTVIAATAVVAATCAALVPARSAARIPVLSALAGRRPVVEPPRWLAPVGIASFVVGLLLLAAVASADGGRNLDGGGDLLAMVAILGALAVVFGMVCASPLIVAAVAAIGGRRRGSVRLAARSLGRSRARSAAVLTAIATVGTAAVIASTATSSAADRDTFYSAEHRGVDVRYFPDMFEEPEAVNGVVDPDPVVAPPLPAELRRTVEEVLPDATWTPIPVVVDDPAPYREVTGVPIGAGASSGEQIDVTPVVADDAVVEAAGFSAAQLTELDETGVLVIGPWYPDEVAVQTLDDPIIVDVSGSIELIDLEARQAYEERGFVRETALPGLEIGSAFVSPAFVEDNALTTTVSSYRVENPVDVTREQAEAISMASVSFEIDAFVEGASAPGFEVDTLTRVDGWSVDASWPASPVPFGLIQIAVALASLLLVLSVVAIGLSLAATESRDERDVLLAVGASPTTLRRVAATKAWVLTTGAAIVAVPVGYITIYVISRATGHNDVTAPFPFAVAAMLLVGIPAVAWLATMSASVAARRFRPVTAGTIAPDL